MGLTQKQQKFLESYQKSNNPTESAIIAGYSAKSAAVEGNRLLKNDKIQLELANYRLNKAKELSKSGHRYSKEDYIDRAVNAFEMLDITEPNAPRFYDIAGKALGYIGNSGDVKANVTNNVQINITGSETPAELWEMTRKLIGG